MSQTGFECRCKDYFIIVTDKAVKKRIKLKYVKGATKPKVKKPPWKIAKKSFIDYYLLVSSQILYGVHL